MIGSSHDWSVFTSWRIGPLNDRPSVESACAQIRVGSPTRPSLLNRSVADPSASTNGCGSMLPRMSIWQTNGCGSSSTNGPSGLVPTARPMHCTPVDRCRAV